MTMQVLEAVGATYDPYPLRRERAAELGARYAFASQVLGFYSRLTEVQARAFGEARTHPSRGRIMFRTRIVLGSATFFAAFGTPPGLAKVGRPEQPPNLGHPTPTTLTWVCGANAENLLSTLGSGG